MKKIIYTLSIVLGLGLSANAQIESLAGPRIGAVYISASPASSFLNGTHTLEDLVDEFPEDYNDIAKGTLTSLYGWQWESRFADGGDVTGVVEWIVLVAGMEKGKFLPSVSSMVGARTYSGLEFAVGPNLSMSGISMVFGMGYNFKSGDLNIPVNFAFVPGRAGTYTETDYIYTPGNQGPDGQWGTADDIPEVDEEVDVYTVDYNTGNRFSITLGFNLSK
jgi:hypothetical protein